MKDINSSSFDLITLLIDPPVHLISHTVILFIHRERGWRFTVSSTIELNEVPPSYDGAWIRYTHPITEGFLFTKIHTLAVTSPEGMCDAWSTTHASMDDVSEWSQTSQTSMAGSGSYTSHQLTSTLTIPLALSSVIHLQYGKRCI